MEEKEILELKNKFINLLKSVKREGINELLDFLENTDFYNAPASTKFHSSYKGGLLKHSLNVYYALKELQQTPIFQLDKTNEDSITIVALLHDICKVKFYEETTRNVKNKETGKWEQEPFYQVNNQIVSCGEHGDKSLMIISSYLKLSPEEMAAIRWHMGAYESKEIWNTLGLAFEKYPLSFAMHVADQIATHKLEIEK